MSPRASSVRFMTPGRWAVIGALAFILLLLVFHLYYQWAQSDYSREERAAVRVAMEEGGIADAKRADKFVWDEKVWVVFGEDREGNRQYVWVADDGVAAVPLEDAYPSDRLKQDVRREHPDADIIRIRPGLAEGKRIWEVYYSRPENGKRYYYGFYGFEDGKPVATYRLPARTAN